MSIAKAELHTHLEGTISPKLYQILAKRNNLPIPPGLISIDGQSYIYKNFLDFLKVYDIVAGAIKCPEDYYDVTFDYLQSNAKNGAIYIEMMYSPDHAEMVSNIPSREHLAAIQKAINDAEHKFNIVGRIIITGVRHFGTDACEKVAAHGIKMQNEYACVVGFGLGGDEINFPPHLFSKAYAIADHGGLNCTIHAGEHAGAETMITAIDTLPIKRIGHGVRAIESQEAIARIKDKNIALEVCPSSNISLGLYPTLSAHPLNQLLEFGLSLSINSDDPPFFRTDLNNEYLLAKNTFGYNDDTLSFFTLMAIEAAFVDERTKNLLKKRLP